MAEKLTQIVISKGEPAKDRLWLNPYDGTVRMHSQSRGWTVVQGKLFTELAGRLAGDEEVIAGKQDALEAGENITIDGNVISASDTKPFVVADALPKMPTAADADSAFLVPEGDGTYTAWVWQDGAWARVGDTHKEMTAEEVDEMWDRT